jgi:hypothetical protein
MWHLNLWQYLLSSLVDILIFSTVGFIATISTVQHLPSSNRDSMSEIWRIINHNFTVYSITLYMYMTISKDGCHCMIFEFMSVSTLEINFDCPQEADIIRKILFISLYQLTQYMYNGPENQDNIQFFFYKLLTIIQNSFYCHCVAKFCQKQLW